VAELSAEQKTVNHKYFLELIQNTLCDPDFEYEKNRWRETNEKIILVMLMENAEFLDALGVTSVTGQIPDLTSGEYQLYYRTLKPSQIERKLRKVFKWKGTLSTVINICRELASWHWLVEQVASQSNNRITYRYTINPEILETCVQYPLDIPESEDYEEEHDEEATD
jgi:hypothetical protein